jgi:antitoxin VapB
VYIIGITKERPMPDTGVAKVFMHGRSQAVRLPKEFRVTGSEVRVRRVGGGILLEPMETDLDAWLAGLRELADPDFPDRDQPPMPPPRDIFD